MNAVEARGLTKRFKERIAVDNFDLTVAQGELFSLLGVNGAGKTTTIRMLCCLLKPSAGDALVMGHSIVKHQQDVNQIINISPQESAIAQNLTVRENLEFVAEIYGMQKEQARQAAGGQMADFGLEEAASQRAGTLSGGQQRRLSIAMALISQPQVLFLDEPTLGLDVLARRELWSVIKQLRGKVTIILTTHYMEEAEALSDRIGIMEKGRLKAVGTAQELIVRTGAKDFEDAFVKLATGGR